MKLREFVQDLPSNEPTVFVVGAVSVGHPGIYNIYVISIANHLEFIDDSISISNYGLSAACVCSKLTEAFEEKWGVHWLIKW